VGGGGRLWWVGWVHLNKKKERGGGGGGGGMQHAWLDYRFSEENIPFGRNRPRWAVNVKM